MNLKLAPETEKALAAMPKADRTRILEALQAVAADPQRRFPFVTELRGRPGAWRLRKGDWRAVFRIEGTDMLVERIAHRKEVYR